MNFNLTMKKLLLPSKIGDLSDLGDLVGRGTSALRLLRRRDKGQKAETGAGAIDSPYFEDEVPPKDMSSPERSPWPSVLHSKSSKLVARLARERTGGIIHGAEGSKNGAAKAASPPESRNPRADGAAGNFSHRVVVRVITKEAKNDDSARDSSPPQPGGQGERQTLEPTQYPNDEVVPPKKAAASRTASGVEQPELIDSEGNPSREGTPNDVDLQEFFSIVSGLASAAKNRGSNLLKTYAGEDGSEESETKMQELMRLLKSGMDFTTTEAVANNSSHGADAEEARNDDSTRESPTQPRGDDNDEVVPPKAAAAKIASGIEQPDGLKNLTTKKLLLPSKIGDLGDLVGRGTSALRLLRRRDKGQKAETGAGAIDSPYFEDEVPPKDMSSPERSPWPSVLHSKSSKLVARLARERTGGIYKSRANGVANDFSRRVVVQDVAQEARNDYSTRESPPQPGGYDESQTLEPTQYPNDEVVPPKKAAASRTASGVEQPELIDSEENPSRGGPPNDVALQESFSIVSGLASAANFRVNSTLETYAGEDGSEASETSMQVLMRLLKSGMDFTTEFRERSHEESTIYSDVTSVPSGFPSRIENDATDDDHSFISELSLNDLHDMSMTEIDDNDDMGMVDAVCWQNENIVMFCGDGENIVVNDLVSNRSREEAE